MNNAKPVSFEIVGGTRVVAKFQDGRTVGWGDAKTERGAKAVLARAAKRYGMKVSGAAAA